MGTFITAVLLIAAVALAIKKIYKDKKSGKSSCGCDCGSCGSVCPVSKGAKKK